MYCNIVDNAHIPFYFFPSFVDRELGLGALILRCVSVSLSSNSLNVTSALSLQVCKLKFETCAFYLDFYFTGLFLL
jgi:hypothetical protein